MNTIMPRGHAGMVTSSAIRLKREVPLLPLIIIVLFFCLKRCHHQAANCGLKKGTRCSKTHQRTKKIEEGKKPLIVFYTYMLCQNGRTESVRD